MSLSTHVLDIVIGQPAKGLRVSLFQDGKDLSSGLTDTDGRCRSLLGDAPLQKSVYRLVFDVGSYLRRMHPQTGGPFLDMVPVEFTVSDTTRHYHVPLLLSPFGYTVYRGS